jgi:hypothetical protein
LHGAGAVGGVAFQRLGRLRRPGRREHKAEAQRAQIEMQIVVCTENSIRIDLVTESLNVTGDGRAVMLLPGPARLTVQVEEPT